MHVALYLQGLRVDIRGLKVQRGAADDCCEAQIVDRRDVGQHEFMRYRVS